MKPPLPRSIRSIRALLVAAVLPLCALTAAESPSLLLEKGIYAEEIERNLDSAIKIYEQIAAEAATSRAIVAQAQYRLAMCYEKQGKKEQAIRLLHELVQSSPTDAPLLAKARAALAEMGAPATEAMTVRKLPFAISGWPEAMSQDGRFIAYEPQGGYDLAVFEVATGKTWPIAKCSEDKSPGGIALSPDGEHIAYDLSDSAIHIAKIDGSETRKLSIVDATKETAWPTEWSQDSSRLFVQCKGRGTGAYRMIAVEVKSGATQEIATMPGRVSDDGRYLARDYRTYPRRITVMDLKPGHDETVLATDAGSVVGWVPGTTKLVFSKNRSFTSDLLVVEIKNGKPAGEPEVLRSNFPIIGPSAQPLCITPEGGIYYFVRKERSEPSELWVMEGFLSSAAPAQEPADLQIEMPPTELIITSDRVILDRKLGLSFTIPTGWTIRTAVRRGNGGNLLSIYADEIRQTSITVQYRLNAPWTPGPAASDGRGNMWGPKKPELEEVSAWLRDVAENTAQRGEQKIKDFKRDPSGFVPRLVGGNKAVIWSASYSKGDVMLTDVNVHVFSEQAHAQISLRAPQSDIDTIRPVFERMVDSFRLP